MSWNLEEGKFTYIEKGYRVEKVEIAYGWRRSFVYQMVDCNIKYKAFKFI